MSLLNEYENLCAKTNDLVMGIDEAGRGPLCGPLVVAGCVFKPHYVNELINDSKKLTEKKRLLIYNQIINDALFYNIKIIEPKEIDRLNIYVATKKAMSEIALSYDVKYVLTDAMPIESNKKVIPIVKGDSKSISIAAASIIAKVTRDNIMYEYDKLYPLYEYRYHKGYPTKRHLELLKKYGILDIYRKSYGPCKDVKLKR